MSAALLLLVVVACLAASLSSAYTISFHSNHMDHPIANHAVLKSDPSATQVADLALRLSGLPPLLKEEHVQLPSASVFSQQVKPLLVEVMGSALPSFLSPAVSTSSRATVSGPKLEEVQQVLGANGLKVEVLRLSGDIDSIEKAIKAETRPMVILHAEPNRQLSGISDAPLTERDISQYQICLWTGVVLVLIVGSSLLSMAGMETNYDSILLSKFLSSRTNDKRD